MNSKMQYCFISLVYLGIQDGYVDRLKFDKDLLAFELGLILVTLRIRP